jgi:hypothetical protein
MRRIFAVVTVLAAVGATGVATAGSAVAAPAAHLAKPAWGTPKRLPAWSRLNKGGSGLGQSIACASPGNCTAGGFYTDGNGHEQAFVATEKNGRWRNAERLPGSGALNSGGNAYVSDVACASAGNCVAVGRYTEASHAIEGFVATQRSGRWSSARTIPGLAALNAGGLVDVVTVSCGSRGNCSAGGRYLDTSDAYQAFVVTEKDGAWGKAIEVPGTAILNTDSSAEVEALSCRSAASCTAGGDVEVSPGVYQPFVVSRANGTWRAAVLLPGLAALNTGSGQINALSCGSPGNCVAGGLYEDSAKHNQAFVARQKNGVWSKAFTVPGTAALNGGGQGAVTAISCSSARNCLAGGGVENAAGKFGLFVISLSRGRWGTARALPGVAALNKGGAPQLYTISCATPGNCVAGGYANDATFHEHAFEATMSGGMWTVARRLPGLAALDTGAQSGVDAVSCPTAGHCGATGYYQDAAHHTQAFVDSRT